MRELGARLVHVHSQHHALLLNDPRFQLGLVDHVAGQTAALTEYLGNYQRWREQQHELTRLRDEEARSSAELDYLRFQLNELDEAALNADEQAVIEQDLGRADHAEELMRALRAVEEGISAERGVLSALSQLKQALAKPARLDPGVHLLAERLNSVHIELKDIGHEADALAAHVTLDPKDATRLRERLDLMLRLQQKHRVNDNEALLAIAEDLRQRTGHIDSLTDRITAMEGEETLLQRTVQEQAKAISRARTKAVKPLANKVEAILQELGMPHAVFQFDHRIGEPGAQGIDTVRALFTANRAVNSAA